MRTTNARVEALETRARRAEEVADILDTLIGKMQGKADESGRKRAKEAGRHPCISLPRRPFLGLLMDVRRIMGEAFHPLATCSHCGIEDLRHATFLDVGCGLADKLVLASDLGFEAHGIEVDEKVSARAKRTFALRLSREARLSSPPPPHAKGGGAITLYPIDALEFDFSGFDVIYFFRPFSDDVLEKRLERRIWEQAKPGAFIIACCPVTTPPLEYRAVKGLGQELAASCDVYRRAKRRR